MATKSQYRVHITTLSLISKARQLIHKSMGKFRCLIFFLYPGGDLDHSQNLMASKLDLLTNTHTNGHEFNTSLAEANISRFPTFV